MNYFHSESFEKNIVCNENYCLQYPMKYAIINCDPNQSKEGCQRLEHLAIPTLFISNNLKKNKIDNPFLNDFINKDDFIYSDNVVEELPIDFENLNEEDNNSDNENDEDDDEIFLKLKDDSINNEILNHFITSVSKSTKPLSRKNKIIKNKTSKNK